MKKISKKTLNHTPRHIIKNNIWGGVIPYLSLLLLLLSANKLNLDTFLAIKDSSNFVFLVHLLK